MDSHEIVPPRRRSAFRETGLDEEGDLSHARSTRERSTMKVRFSSHNDIIESSDCEDYDTRDDNSDSEALTTIRLPQASLRPRPSSLDKFTLFAFIVGISIFIAQIVPLGRSRMMVVEAAPPGRPANDSSIRKRQSTDPTDYCKRWSGQSAIVNGTIYYYGGRKTTSSSQTSNTWVNDFFTIDLTKSWQISAPSMAGLAQPSGPPAVSLGSLWNSHTSLFLYGGEFSDNPTESPTVNSLWEYNIGSKGWIEHENPQTTAGKNSEAAGEPIQRAAEGAGISLPSLGRGWYFGGHLDFLTTQGWSIQTPRVYLKSFVEYTFPGVTNPELSTQNAGSDGAWRNITSAGIQQQSGFTQRADGILVYVPGFSAEGLLLSLGGGTNESFTQMNEIDVFDIAGSQWYRQATSGTTPIIRVNPCAVVAAAADGSSYNIYMFGGQNLIPYNQQIQYDDMWILSVPSFTWIQVNMTGQSIPPARAGHTCNIWDGQMVMVGGYLGADITCEQPGVYVFNASSLTWQNQFTALSSGNDKNAFSQQNSQKGSTSKDGLEGSFGYEVPPLVYSAIGGNANGGATKTADNPAGPFSTGTPITYTLDGSPTDGATGGRGSSNGNAKSSRGPIIGAIVAGVVGFLLLLLVVYFAICAYIYRKQMRMWRQHCNLMQERQSEKDGSFYASHSPTFTRDGRQGHESLIGPYHRPSASIDTSGTSNRHPDTSSPNSSTEDLMDGFQPSFWGWNGVLLHPRRSLRIVNRDEPPATRDNDSR